MRATVALAGAAMALGGCSFLGSPPAAEGDCVDLDVDSSVVDKVNGFDCAKEHDAEVYFKGNVAGQGEYDAAAVEQAAIDLCLAKFASFVGIEYFESTLDVYYVYPKQEGWDEGDRAVTCAVFTPDGATGGIVRTTGSLEGSAM